MLSSRSLHAPRASTFVRGALFLGLIVGNFAGPLRAADGVIYFNRLQSLTAPAVVRRVNGDGTSEQAVPIGLPSALYPTASRDGQQLLVTSTDPGRPFKISNNVFRYELATGLARFVTHYEDTVTSKGVILTNDLGQQVGDRDISGYTINFPYHKAFSPDGSRVVVMNLRKTGSATGDAFNSLTNGPGQLTVASSRFPVVDVFRVADAFPDGAYVFLGVDRDGFNQGGDGVDWHPSRAEVIATVSSDIPATGNSGHTGMEGTVLAVFTAPGPSQFLGKLTNPTGEWNFFSDGFNFFSLSAAQNDYAPAISADGQRVAYVRHLLRVDSRVDLAPRPALCSVHVVNYNGSDDHEIVSLNEGWWITKVAWSPDGTKIALDIAPQLQLSGWFSPIGDVTQSEIHVVNADGSNPHRLVAAPAAFPSWSLDPGPVTPPARPVLHFKRVQDHFEVQVDKLVIGRPARLEGSIDLKNWDPLYNWTPDAPTQTLTVNPDPNSPMAWYRIAVP